MRTDRVQSKNACSKIQLTEECGIPRYHDNLTTQWEQEDAYSVKLGGLLATDMRRSATQVRTNP